MNIKFLDPAKINKSYKSSLISANLIESRSGIYKAIPKYPHIPFKYTETDINKPETTSIVEVDVVYMHSLEVAYLYADIGVPQFTKNNKLNPVIVNIVDYEFLDISYESTDNIRDEIINIRTNFCNSESRQNIFPIVQPTCIYTKSILVIRPPITEIKNIFLDLNNVYRTSVITTCPIKKDKLIDNFECNDFKNTLYIIENIFQCAIANKHVILIL